ncbi:MAG: DUF5752 family protein [Gammaproteobacteria bacterium]|nr:DUF5752 family protein [Gammaproteobacteria bacterium]
MSPGTHPFEVRDCALVAIATGRRAQTLRELRDGLLDVPKESIYYHFWGRLLRPRLDDTEFHNDFAAWIRHCLHDETLSERLAIIDPADFTDLEELRQELLDAIEVRLDETDVQFSRRDRQFHFRRCQTVVFDTGVRIHEPAALATAIPSMSLGSLYYHVIDARWREPVRTDDFRTWLGQFGAGYQPLLDQLAAVDPYFSTLAELREELGATVGAFLRGGGAK